MSIISQFLTASAKDKIQTFTASGTFTVPDGVYTLFVTMCAAGGGRYMATYSGYTYGGGGGGGYFVNYPLAVTPGDVLTITIGAGGTSRYYNGTTYGNYTIGGNTKISLGASDLLIAYGGSYGSSTPNPTTGVWLGGAGGYPNGPGGGAYAGGAGGCGLAKGTAIIGGGHNVSGTGNYDSLWGMGPMKGVGTNSAQSMIPGYGGGEYNGASAQTSAFTAGTVKGEPGIVTLKWIGA
jgi:hypothetical protein